MPSLKITRFEGVQVPGWFGPRPGGGMRGATDKLDRMVERAAGMLQGVVRRDVVIRFNLDRMSGGAFVASPASMDEELGISVGIYKEKYRINVFAASGTLDDVSLAECGTDDHKYACPTVRTLAAAVRWIEAHCSKAVRRK